MGDLSHPFSIYTGMDTFNSRFMNAWKELSKAKVGIEFEFFSNHSYVKTVEMLNLALQPVEVWGFNAYHTAFEVTDRTFKIEPDFSGGSEMVELITGPMTWMDARMTIIKMLEFIKKNGYTDDHCSVHINVSLEDMEVKDLNVIKMILSLDEDFVYSKFPSRRNNIYARSIKWIVPFEGFTDTDGAINSIMGGFSLPDDTKYYGVNFQKKWKNYLEFRYIGGADYQNKSEDILALMDYFILQTRLAITDHLTQEDMLRLSSYLDDNINWMKRYKTYDEFLANIDGMKIVVDLVDEYTTVKNTWDKFKTKLFDVIKGCDTIQNATINYNSVTGRLEIIEATISDIYYIKGVDFVNCQIKSATFHNCDVIDSDIEEAHIYNTNIYESRILNSKLMNCKATEWSVLTGCMFDGGLLDCVMKEGVFRSGQLGENADMEPTVKIATKSTFWNIDPGTKKTDKLK